jgi:glyoxylase-like metal-dependent hydrolase (beta-lactamase superfamily II)
MWAAYLYIVSCQKTFFLSLPEPFMNLTKSFASLATTAAMSLAVASSAAAGSLGTYTSDDKGFDTHTYWYDDGREVTIIDTQFVPALTQAMLDQISKATKSPITRVIVTHPNPDKFNGLPLMHAMGVASVASKATADSMKGVHDYKKYFWINIAKAFTEDNYPKFEPVKTTFSDQTKISLKSGETLSLIELKHTGVASTQTVVRIDRTGDLIVGDLIHYKAHAWLEGGIVNGKAKPDLNSWREAVAELPLLVTDANKSKVYGGRGAVGTVVQAVAFERDYLAKADALVTDYVKQTPSTELKDAAQAQKHHQALQAAFDKAMPGLALPYLIGYGVYGLLDSKLN